MKLDLEYVDRWTFWFDAQILWRSFRVVFTGKGAY
jgi:lipopolysaccharide/colanic/teichoic acid biosynthesis glycosyltransferase